MGRKKVLSIKSYSRRIHKIGYQELKIKLYKQAMKKGLPKPKGSFIRESYKAINANIGQGRAEKFNKLATTITNKMQLNSRSREVLEKQIKEKARRGRKPGKITAGDIKRLQKINRFVNKRLLPGRARKAETARNLMTNRRRKERFAGYKERGEKLPTQLNISQMELLSSMTREDAEEYQALYNYTDGEYTKKGDALDAFNANRKDNGAADAANSDLGLALKEKVDAVKAAKEKAEVDLIIKGW